MLSASAFNAFLKTLEEPPRHAIFILATTEKHKILPTILSRCQIYDFNRISVEDTVNHLSYVASKEGITAEPEALNVIAMKADGGMRDALSIFDQVVSFTGGNITYKSVIDNLNVLDYEYYFRLTDCFLENKVSDALLLFNDILNKGFDGSHFITGLSSHFRVGTEAGDDIVRALGRIKYAVKSKTMRGENTEMAVEVFCKDPNMEFADRIRAVKGVQDVTIVGVPSDAEIQNQFLLPRNEDGALNTTAYCTAKRNEIALEELVSQSLDARVNKLEVDNESLNLQILIVE